MPYPLSLKEYYRPEWDREPPPEWAARIAEISERTDRMAHLRFRYFEPHPVWNHGERGQWTLYIATPRHLVERDRAELFQLHWSELPGPTSDFNMQQGRKSVVSNYQHYMWHTQGVEVMPFWILQGEFGGTPAAYTPRERRYLDACDAVSDPFPLGFFPACPFDERAVKRVQDRDRFLQAGKSIDALEKMDRPEYLKAEDEAAERLHRETFLDNWFETMKPQAEFMQRYLRSSDADFALPKATREQSNAVAQWKDHFIETGHVLGAGIARSRRVPIAAN